MRTTISGIEIWRLDDGGPLLGSLQSALDLIGESYGSGAELIVVPVRRLDPAFFRLGTGLAGAFIEKLQQYGYRVAVAGDFSSYLEKSVPLQDFVRETDRRGHHLFVTDEDELRRRLAVA